MDGEPRSRGDNVCPGIVLTGGNSPSLSAPDHQSYMLSPLRLGLTSDGPRDDSSNQVSTANSDVSTKTNIGEHDHTHYSHAPAGSDVDVSVPLAGGISRDLSEDLVSANGLFSLPRQYLTKTRNPNQTAGCHQSDVYCQPDVPPARISRIGGPYSEEAAHTYLSSKGRESYLTLPEPPAARLFRQEVNFQPPVEQTEVSRKKENWDSIPGLTWERLQTQAAPSCQAVSGGLPAAVGSTCDEKKQEARPETATSLNKLKHRDEDNNIVLTSSQSSDRSSPRISIILPVSLNDPVVNLHENQEQVHTSTRDHVPTVLRYNTPLDISDKADLYNVANSQCDEHQEFHPLLQHYLSVSQTSASLPSADFHRSRHSCPWESGDTEGLPPETTFDSKNMGDFAPQKNGLKLEVSPENEYRGTNGSVNGHAKDWKKSLGKVKPFMDDAEGEAGADKDKIEEGSGPCGWGWFMFEICQRFRDARWFLVVLTLCGACQGMAVNGFVNTVISTVERRFEISSTESGLIASCYDIMFVLLVIPVSYFGGQGHKPRYLGVGILVLGLGSFVFSLPHFIADHYRVDNADETVCKLESNSTSSCRSASSASLSDYKYFFYLGQLLHGAGATPLYTLGVTYMDENVSQRSSSFYNGIFYTGAIIGPAIGYMVGAKFLDMYTDLSVDPTSMGLDPSNPKWVGAWWIGFLINGLIGVLLSLPLLAFPAALPGSQKFALERGKETQASTQVDQTGQHHGVKDILLSLKYLLTNIPFMFINIAAAADGILVAGFSTFMPKFIEYQFGLPAGTAALYVGLAVVPAGGGATFAGGFIVKFFNLKMRGILRLCTVMSFILCVLAVSFLMECKTTPFAGVTLPYGQTNVGAATFLGKNLQDSCNQNCSCSEEDYYPLCGLDQVLYFSPCYAGCQQAFTHGNIKRYTNCSCVNYNLTAEDYATGKTHMAEFGKCQSSCHWLTIFMIVFGIMIVFVFITSMPSLTATLRCVPDHQRSFGLGIQWIVARCLGSIPGPILFGKIFDFACLVWQKRCKGEGSCFFYDTNNLSLYLLGLALTFAVGAAVSFLLALCFYKAKEEDDEIVLRVNTSSVPSTPSSPHNGKSSLNMKQANFDLHRDYTGTNL